MGHELNSNLILGDNPRDGRKEQQQIEEMIKYGQGLVGIGRGEIGDMEKYLRADVGPFWAKGSTMPSRSRIEKEGVICIGLLSLCLRSIGLLPPFLDKKNLKDLEYGYGGTDEWLYTFKDKVEIFNTSAVYPKGTLLFRVYNVIDQGHVAILIEESGPTKKLMDCRVLQSGGQPLGSGVVSDTDIVRMQHEYYSRGTHWLWDGSNQFSLDFKNIGYYTHALIPSEYLHDCLKISDFPNTTTQSQTIAEYFT